MLTDGRTDARTDGRTHRRTDDGRKVITIAHPEQSSGELKIFIWSSLLSKTMIISLKAYLVKQQQIKNSLMTALKQPTFITRGQTNHSKTRLANQRERQRERERETEREREKTNKKVQFESSQMMSSWHIPTIGLIVGTCHKDTFSNEGAQ